MNVTKFFNLSILEVEDYLRLEYSKLNLQSPWNKRHCEALAESIKKMLIGILHLSTKDNIHVVKKSNLYDVYAVYYISEDREYGLSFGFGRKEGHWIDIIFLPGSFEIGKIVCDYHSSFYHINKRMKIKDFLPDEYN